VDLDLDEALDLGAGAAPLWSVAAGLGLHEVAHDGAKNADVNGADFLPETFAAAEAGRKSTFHYAAVLCVALVLMLAWYVFGGRELREMKHRLATLGPQVAGAHERRNTLAQLEKEKSQLSVQAATYRKVAPPLTTTSVIAVIGDLIPSSLALKALSVSSPPAQPKAPQSKDKAHRKRKKTEIQPIEPMKLDLVGLASTDLDVARFERRLVEHELFSHVKLIFSRPIEIGELAAREFRIEAQTPLDRRYVQAGTEQEVAHAD
jgi:Tfp pilus assembly protein PilN